MYRPEFELVALNKPHCTVHEYIENSNQPHQRRNFARVIRIPHSGTWISWGLGWAIARDQNTSTNIYTRMDDRGQNFRGMYRDTSTYFWWRIAKL